MINSVSAEELHFNSMSDLVARTGRHQQRYESGCRLVAGCIPFRYRNSDESNDDSSEKSVEVLMINSTSRPGLLFPKVPSISNSSEGDKELVEGMNKFPLQRMFETKRDLLLNQGFAWKDSLKFEGGWENDETVEEAAVREALEEAGVRGDLMHFLGCYHFKSKTHQDKFSPEGLCRAAMFALLVKEELDSWPEQSTRKRSWLSIPEAIECCRHPWMREALEDGFSKWVRADQVTSTEEDHFISLPSSLPNGM